MVFVNDRTTHLVMDAISGDTLEAAAFKMQSTALQKTAEQLPAVDQLQSLTSEFPCPGEQIYYGQWPGKPFASHNRRFPDTMPAFSFDDLLRYVLPSDSDIGLFNIHDSGDKVLTHVTNVGNHGTMPCPFRLVTSLT